MRVPVRRVRQLIVQSPENIVWLGFILAIASWAHRVVQPLHMLRRWQVQIQRKTRLDDRLALLRRRVAALPPTGGFRIALAELDRELDDICRPLRRVHREIALADIDQDGLLWPRLGKLWAGCCAEDGAFARRERFDLTVVDYEGWVGVRKQFRQDRAAFANELEALLDLQSCNVPTIFHVDFEQLAIISAYIHGVVVREALAQAGAPMRDRDVAPTLSGMPTLSRVATLIRYHWLDKQRIEIGRRLIDQIFDRKTLTKIGEAVLAIHRTGYALEDIKYGNVIIEAQTNTPYFVDCERALPLRKFSPAAGTWLRDRDAEKLNLQFGTDLPTAKRLRRSDLPGTGAVYAPFYARAGVWWGAIWNPDAGAQRWRYMLADYVPVPRGGRVLDLGANNGFNALQMLRAGAADVVGIEIEHGLIEQGLFVKRVFEWADNTQYRFSYIHGSHTDIPSLKLGQFDLVTAFCTLYYLSRDEMKQVVTFLAKITDTLVLQCNEENWIERSDLETFTKASLAFNIELVQNNGFPHVTTIRRRGSARPLVIARNHLDANNVVSKERRESPAATAMAESPQWAMLCDDT